MQGKYSIPTRLYPLHLRIRAFQTRSSFKWPGSRALRTTRMDVGKLGLARFSVDQGWVTHASNKDVTGELEHGAWTTRNSDRFVYVLMKYGVHYIYNIFFVDICHYFRHNMHPPTLESTSLFWGWELKVCYMLYFKYWICHIDKGKISMR